MREIKFRAWHKEVNRWVNIEHISNKGDVYTRGAGVSCGAWSHSTSAYVEKAILMQYTGLKDKNGVEIYEGDIICNIGLNGERDDIAIVKWVKRDMQFECQFKATLLNLPSAEFVEVIGNIYENSELLEKK